MSQDFFFLQFRRGRHSTWFLFICIQWKHYSNVTQNMIIITIAMRMYNVQYEFLKTHHLIIACTIFTFSFLIYSSSWNLFYFSLHSFKSAGKLNWTENELFFFLLVIRVVWGNLEGVSHFIITLCLTSLVHSFVIWWTHGSFHKYSIIHKNSIFLFKTQ